jgi:hypothetical protein
MIQNTVVNGSKVFFVADDLGMPVSFGYSTEQQAIEVAALIERSEGQATIPAGVKIVTIETTRDEIVDAVTSADLCSPEQVCDAVLAVANAGGDWRAELAKAVANDAAERDPITKRQVDLCQGQDFHDRDFGYVAGDEGGYFFTWMPTLSQTLDSIEEDEQDGAGDLDERNVRDFLESYLPTTKRGVKLWGEAE